MKNSFSKKKHLLDSNISHIQNRRAVAPVIATLLLVAIAVVGGSVIFVFSQGFFNSTQVTGLPQIESVKILGYDAQDGNSIQFHDGIIGNVISGGPTSDGLLSTEYITVYLENTSVTKVTISEIRVAGTLYDYHDFAGSTLPDFGGSLADKEYALVNAGLNGADTFTINSSAPELEAGEQISMVLALDKNMQQGRDMQYKITTTNGAVFVGTILTGQQNA